MEETRLVNEGVKSPRPVAVRRPKRQVRQTPRRVNMEGLPKPYNQSRHGKSKRRFTMDNHVHLGQHMRGELTDPEKSSSLEETELKFANARRHVSNVMQRPNTRRNAERYVANIDENSQKAYMNVWDEQEPMADLEASLLLYNAVLGLAFRHTGGRTQNRIHGEYFVIVNTSQDNPTEDFDITKQTNEDLQIAEVEEEWVIDNFDPQTTLLAQRLGIERERIYEWDESNDDGETVKQSDKGYLELPEEDTQATWDDMQVSALRFTKQHWTTDEHGNRQKIDAVWHGIVKPTKFTNRRVTLTEEWVNNNVDPNVAKYIKEEGDPTEEQCHGFVSLPPGDSKSYPDQPPISAHAPVVKYRQSALENTCLIKAAASAAHCTGHEKLGKRLESIAMSRNHMLKVWEKVLDEVGKNRGVDRLQPRRIKFKDDAFEVASSCVFLVMALHGSDGSTTHAVAIAGKWIFDSNLATALPLTKESLDFCCSTEEKRHDFVGVHKGYAFLYR